MANCHILSLGEDSSRSTISPVEYLFLASKGHAGTRDTIEFLVEGKVAASTKAQEEYPPETIKTIHNSTKLPVLI